VVFIDGVEVKEYGYRSVHGLTFSPDSKHVAYVADFRVVVDGVEGKQYNNIESPIFSPDSKRVAYAATSGNKQLVVVNGVEGKAYGDFSGGTAVKGIIFSPDSKRVAYAAKREDKWLVVVDGLEGKEYRGIGTIVFSPDSKRIAYCAKRDNKWVLVVDGVESKEYDEFAGETESLDPLSRLVPFLAFDSPNKLHALALRNGEVFLVEIEITD